MDGPLPLDKRLRRMNLFDVKSDILESVGYIEEVLESNINITNTRDRCMYTPLLLPRLGEVFTPEDTMNSTLIICLSSLGSSRLSRFLDQFFKGFYVSDVNGAYHVRFHEERQATACLYLSNEDFSFFRPRNYVELPTTSVVEFSGSKYCSNVPSSPNKILLGPLNIAPAVLRDALDEISRLQSFRMCRNPRYFVFTFQDAGFSDAFIKITSHLFILDYNQVLVSERAYKSCSILDFTKNTPDLVPRRMTGPIAFSKEKTRIVVLQNMVGPWNTNVSEIIEIVRRKSLEYGNVKDVMSPGYGDQNGIKEPGSFKIFVECSDLETSQRIYESFGGLVFEDRIVVSGYYPELNYLAGEYE